MEEGSTLYWPVRFILGLVRYGESVEECEIPAYAWIVDVYRWIEGLMRRGGIREDVDQLLEDPAALATLDPSHPAFPMVSWIRDRARLTLLRAQNSWARWFDYAGDLWIPGESEMDRPALFLDTSRQMLYMLPQANILAYHLEDGLPEDWGWRVVGQDELQRIAEDPDHVETVLRGTQDHVTMVSLRKAQREKRRSERKDDLPRAALPGRVDAVIRRLSRV